MTRAKALLVIVGNPGVLGGDPHWGALLRHAVAHGAYRGVPLPPAFDVTAHGVAPQAVLPLAGDDEGRPEANVARGLEEGPAWQSED